MALKILGLMSGSSLDGLDLAICEFTGGDYIIHDTDNVPFNHTLVNLLKDPFSLTAKKFIELEGELSLFLGRKVVQFLNRSAHRVDLIVSHGHTIYHNPENRISCQIGNGGILASMTGIDTLCDLRIQDIAIGGQGAPLASLVDQYLFADYGIKLNLGGIANISISDEKTIRSWDITPCNQVLNHLSGLKGLPYDDKGIMARKGSFNNALYARWQMLDYFNNEPPKSMDNYWIKEQFLSLIGDEKIDDALHTSTIFIADAIASELNKYLPQGDNSMLVTGGGAHNEFLVECIQDKTNVDIVLPEFKVIDYKEALLMAFMGYRYLNGEINVISSATGSKRDIIAGALYLGNGQRQ